MAGLTDPFRQPVISHLMIQTSEIGALVPQEQPSLLYRQRALRTGKIGCDRPILARHKERQLHLRCFLSWTKLVERKFYSHMDEAILSAIRILPIPLHSDPR